MKAQIPNCASIRGLNVQSILGVDVRKGVAVLQGFYTIKHKSANPIVPLVSNPGYTAHFSLSVVPDKDMSSNHVGPFRK
jgi:hypothetical protein